MGTKTLKTGSKVRVVAEGTALWVGTVGIVAAHDAAGVTLRVGEATVTVPRNAVVQS